MDFTVSVKTNFSPAAIERNIRFGTARGLTTTATQAQNAVIDSIQGTFTTRSKWYLPSTPVGIKREIATPATMKARVFTDAGKFLSLHESGGIKLPYKNDLAIPADKGPLNKKRIIPENLRPNNLAKTFGAKNVFVITMPGTGTRILCVRGFFSVKQFTSRMVPMYVLVKKATIKKESTFFDPIMRVCNERLKPNIAEQIQAALDGIKEISKKV